MEEKDKNNETAWMGEVIQILPIESERSSWSGFQRIQH